MTTPRTLILCCNNARCPVVTQISDTAYSITDDYGATQKVTPSDLISLKNMGSAAPSPDSLVKFGMLKMRADQANLATDILV